MTPVRNITGYPRCILLIHVSDIPIAKKPRSTRQPGSQKPPGDQSGLEVTKTASDSETILDWALIRLNPERETSNTSVSPFITRLFSFISCAI